mmetsp:Transcript_6472/g.27542  ORF Transcript_6472/g.27542 Transcript_6472/m.27542 type:complete len:91 (-) Transcript_6472:1591-1863(-)
MSSRVRPSQRVFVSRISSRKACLANESIFAFSWTGLKWSAAIFFRRFNDLQAQAKRVEVLNHGLLGPTEKGGNIIPPKRPTDEFRSVLLS